MLHCLCCLAVAMLPPNKVRISQQVWTGSHLPFRESDSLVGDEGLTHKWVSTWEGGKSHCSSWGIATWWVPLGIWVKEVFLWMVNNYQPRGRKQNRTKQNRVTLLLVAFFGFLKGSLCSHWFHCLFPTTNNKDLLQTQWHKASPLLMFTDSELLGFTNECEPWDFL